jgi:trafficking protein particle complex subunit 12
MQAQGENVREEGRHPVGRDVAGARLPSIFNDCLAVGRDEGRHRRRDFPPSTHALTIDYFQEFVAAAKHLEPLCVQGAVTSPTFRSAVARIYLQGGYIAKAVEHIAIVDADTTADQNTKNMNAALLASAQGEWASASEIWKRSIELDSENYAVSADFLPRIHAIPMPCCFLQAVNDLSVSLLGQGRLKEVCISAYHIVAQYVSVECGITIQGIEILETALATSPSSVVVAEPFLFNLCTPPSR